MNNQELIPINQDTIRELRQSGRGYEANQLLKAFYKSKKDERKQTEKEYWSEIRKIKKHLGLCVYTFCSKPQVKGKRYCKVHG